MTQSGTPGHEVPPPRKARVEPWHRGVFWAWVRAVAAWIALIALSLLVVHADSGWNRTRAHVTMPTPLGRGIAWWGLLAAWFGATLVIARATRRTWAAVGITGVAVGVSLCGSGVLGFARAVWHVEDRITTRDGRDLVALYQAGFDPVHALGEPVSSGFLHQEFALLWREERYPGQSGATVWPDRIRRGDRMFFEQLADGTLVVLGREDSGWKGAIFAVGPAGERPVLSPFALFGPDGLASGTELADAIRDVGRDGSGRDGMTDAHLLAALEHDNAWVRDAAGQLVDAGGTALFPLATRRLAALRRGER